jgi:hypothetical protein
MDNLSKKLASNDKILETISNKMESFFCAIKNQHSFNKMIDSQISQLASSIPTTNPGEFPGQPEELKSANLSISIMQVSTPRRQKKAQGGLTRTCLPRKVGAYTFENTLYDFGSSVNIMPKVIYEKIEGSEQQTREGRGE